MKKPANDHAKMLRRQRRIGERIASLRHKHDPPLQQNQLAKDAGINPASLNQIERGHRMPDVKTVYRLADVLQITPGAILDPGTHGQREEEPPAAPPEYGESRSDISATVQEAAYAAFADIAAAILDTVTTGREAESRGQTAPPRRTAAGGPARDRNDRG